MEFSFRNKIVALAKCLDRLRRDSAGNVLVMAAAFVIPLIAMVGSGLDLSRAYMAQARLQMACDAGALAGRRAMSGGVFSSNVSAEAVKFFRFNFPTGDDGNPSAYNVTAFTPVVTDGGNASVKITAATTVKTTLMSMFGYTAIPIDVTCFARQDFVNTDVVLVLDTTGSMAQDVTNHNVPTNDPSSKIVGLRNAVLALYDELKPVQDQLTAVGLRLRYGIVPYSITVNAGAAIRSVNSNYIQTNPSYQSRVANFTTIVPVAGSPYVTQTYSSNLNASNCLSYGSNKSYPTTDGSTFVTGTAPSQTVTLYKASTWGGSTNISGSGTKSCVRTVTTGPLAYGFTSWTYQQVTSGYDVSNFKAGNTIAVATDTVGTMANSGSYTVQQLATSGTGFATAAWDWDGCIEERDTVPSITSSSGLSIPTGAFDLDIDLVPNNDATRWRPHWSDIIYTRNSVSSSNPTATATTGTLMTTRGSNYYACPAEAKRLQTWTRADLNTYLNTLTPDGYTYHDIGMIWGGRMLSPDGIFSADNPSTYNSMPVSRFIIYMTDGLLNTVEDAYTAYGVEYLDKRVTGGFTTSADQDDRHNQRFAMACQSAKTKGASIWVISFASSLSTQLTNCASSPSQASVSSNSTQLTQKFVEIGKNIGALRLTQ